MNKCRDGFSLIEVIIAVAIMAIVSVPILMYFTNAAVQSAHGRDEQAADMAAQTVIEEIDALDDFENVIRVQDSLDKLGEGWVIDSEEDDDEKTVLHKSVSVNGNDYVARATVDYSKYTAYNNYENPHIPTLYSASSTVISLSDEDDIAAARLYKEVNGKIYDGLPAADGTNPLDTIKAAMTRDIFVKATAAADSNDCEVICKYTYSYSGKSVEYVVKSTNLTLDDAGTGELCGNLFIIFKPILVANGDTASFDVDLGDDGRKIGITYIIQGATDEEKTAYGTTMFGSVPGSVRVMKNFGSVDNEAVPTETDKRIAYVTVDVYDIDAWEGTSPRDDAKIEATSTTTKSI